MESISLRKEISLWKQLRGADLSFVNLGITIEHLPNSITVFSSRIAFPRYHYRAWDAGRHGHCDVQTLREEGRTDIYCWILRYAIIFSIMGG